MIEQVFENGMNIVKKLKETQMEHLKEASIMIAKAHMEGHKFFVSGSGHSHTVAEELYGRAGSLAFTIPILTPELTLTDHPTKSTLIERLEGYASILADLYHISKDDVVLIASNSGRNPYPVELALEAKKRGAKVIAITNLKHTLSVTSRHSSNKRLFELADIVIDNCGEIGDASLPIGNDGLTICPTSSIANAFICSSLNAGICQYFDEHNHEIEVFVSANVDGGYEKNLKYFERYTRLY